VKLGIGKTGIFRQGFNSPATQTRSLIRKWLAIYSATLCIDFTKVRKAGTLSGQFKVTKLFSFKLFCALEGMSFYDFQL
jgi:hypothetical protein